MGAPGTWRWRATGTDWVVHHDGGVDATLAGAVAALVHADEQRWSRFRPTSDVARLSAAAGAWVAIAPETAELLRAAEAARQATDGRFDPLLGQRLAAWGYVAAPGDGAPETAPCDDVAPRGAIEVAGGPGRERARIPRGAALDLGGIAKAWMAARAARLLADRGAGRSIAVSAGGDVVASRGELVARVVPVEGHPVAGDVRVPEGGGVATSGSGRRTWRLADGTAAHHILDPSTGRPTAAAHATVVASDPVIAEIEATACVVDPLRVLASPLAALVRLPDGTALASAGWDAVHRIREEALR